MYYGFFVHILLFHVLITWRLKEGECLQLLSVFFIFFSVSAVKCFACEFNRNSCPILGGCPSNRDRCSVRHFNHWTTPIVDCPGEFMSCQRCFTTNSFIKHYKTAGCQTFLVTDPVGDVIVWKRGCSNQPPTGSRSNICTTEYVMGSFRVDSCLCNRYLCNSAPARLFHASKDSFGISLTVLTSFITLLFNWKILLHMKWNKLKLISFPVINYLIVSCYHARIIQVKCNLTNNSHNFRGKHF